MPVDGGDYSEVSGLYRNPRGVHVVHCLREVWFLASMYMHMEIHALMYVRTSSLRTIEVMQPYRRAEIQLFGGHDCFRTHRLFVNAPASGCLGGGV